MVTIFANDNLMLKYGLFQNVWWRHHLEPGEDRVAYETAPAMPSRPYICSYNLNLTLHSDNDV